MILNQYKDDHLKYFNKLLNQKVTYKFNTILKHLFLLINVQIYFKLNYLINF